MPCSVVNLYPNENKRKRIEFFPAKQLAEEFVYRVGWYDSRGVIINETNKERHYSVVKDNTRIRKNVTLEEAQDYCEGISDVEILKNTIDVVMMDDYI